MCVISCLICSIQSFSCFVAYICVCSCVSAQRVYDCRCASFLIFFFLIYNTEPNNLFWESVTKEHQPWASSILVTSVSVVVRASTHTHIYSSRVFWSLSLLIDFSYAFGHTYFKRMHKFNSICVVAVCASLFCQQKTHLSRIKIHLRCSRRCYSHDLRPLFYDSFVIGAHFTIFFFCVEAWARCACA